MIAQVEGPSPLSRLFDLSVEIERHQADLQFAESGTIHYVFDENVFELFAYPFQNRALCQVFLGTNTGGERYHRSHTAAAAQSALVTAEILFSGSLPGQKDARILLTPWHREELLDRMNEITRAAYAKRETLRNIDPRGIESQKKFFETVRAKEGQTKSTLGAKTVPLASPALDPSLTADVGELRQEGVSEEALALFYLTREEALRLCRDNDLAPLEQLSRILDTEIQTKLAGVPSLWRPPPSTKVMLDDRALFWNGALQREILLHERQGARRAKTRGALENDARSLALLEWVASQLPSSERIVLVSGDRTLIDTYRRNYAERRTQTPSRRMPFLLRSAVQYAAIFNAPTAIREAAHVDKLLEQVRDALNTSLITYQIAALSNEPDDTGVDDRVLTELQSQTLQPLPPRGPGRLPYQENPIDKFWTEQIGRVGGEATIRNLSDIDQRWRKAERMTIGLASELVAKRVLPEKREFFEQLRDKSAPDQERLILEHVEKIVAKLAISSLEVWKPIARKFFLKASEGSSSVQARVPLAVKLSVLYQGTARDLVGLLLADGSRDSSIFSSDAAAEFLDSPFELFVAAALLALLKREWRMANHFCDLATTSFEFLRPPHPTTTEVRASEAFYMAALARRIRLGEIDASLAPDGYDLAQRMYRSAIEALAESKIRGSDARAPDEVKRFRAFRFSSELAALELFMACSCYDARQSETAAVHHATAKIELELCSEFLQRAASQFNVRADDPATALIARQALVNIAAWFVVGDLLGTSESGINDTSLAQQLANSESDLIESMSGQMQALFMAELLAFDVLRGVNTEASIVQLRGLDLSNERVLVLDRRLFRWIIARYTNQASPPRATQQLQ